MKFSFKTNKLLTAVKETKHTITTSEGKTIHKKLASKPIKFQLSRKPEERQSRQTVVADVENSAKENSATHIRE